MAQGQPRPETHGPAFGDHSQYMNMQSIVFKSMPAIHFNGSTHVQGSSRRKNVQPNRSVEIDNPTLITPSIVCIPGWDCLGTVLDSMTRTTLGQAQF